MVEDIRDATGEAASWLLKLRERPNDLQVLEEFEAWLDAEGDHARAWVSVTEIFEAIGETEPELEAIWRRKTIVQSEKARPSLVGGRKTSSHALRPKRWLMAGAVAAMLAFFVVPDALLRLQSDFTTHAGEVRTVVLADKSAVKMGPETAIAVEFEEGRRTVKLLSGQAWFDVTHDPGSPFRVVAGRAEATVLGTSFDVRRFRNDTLISVRDGRVRVVGNTLSAKRARTLGAGDWIRLRDDRATESGHGNAALLGAWREGSIVARNRPISDVIDEVRPWYAGKIVVLNSALGSERIDGVYDAGDPERAVKAMIAQSGSSVRMITPWLMIIS